MHSADRTAPPKERRSPPASGWEPSTVRLNKADVTLFQSLGEPAQRRACLVLYSGEDLGRRFAIDGERLLLGRAADAGAQIDHPAISRHHAELRQDGDAVLLRDLGSANGTFVGDQRVHDVVALKDGDIVRIGDLLLKFYERHSLDALLHDRIYRLATVDAGTAVFTKKYLLDALQRELQRARRSGRPLALVCLDLDHFKRVNDDHGHNAGDLVLREAAAAVQGAVRGTDIVGRMGGEEFAIVLPETELAAALTLAERVRAAVAGQRYEIDAGGSRRQLRQTASLGVAAYAPPMRNARELLGAADAQLYDAKRQGRNRVCG